MGLRIRLEFQHDVVAEINGDDLQKELTVGRSRDCTWCTPVEDSAVGRQHVRIYRKGRAVFLEDLGTKNGSFLDGKRLRKRLKLHPGQRIRIGLSVITVSAEEKEATSAGFEPLLEVKSGSRKGFRVPVGLRGARIGSDPAADLVLLDDLLVSRDHAFVGQAEGACWIEDRGSTNGTRVDGELLASNRKRPLKPGNLIQVAHVDILYTDGALLRRRGSLWKSLLVFAATLGVLVGAFLFRQGIQDDAQGMLAAARAAAADERFEEAQKLLLSAMDARGHGRVQDEVEALRTQLDSWRATAGRWHRAEATLRDATVWESGAAAAQSPALLKLAEDLNHLTTFSTGKNWEWNLEQGERFALQAVSAKRVLDQWFALEGLLKATDLDLDRLTQALKDLEQTVRSVAEQESPPPDAASPQSDVQTPPPDVETPPPDAESPPPDAETPAPPPPSDAETPLFEGLCRVALQTHAQGEQLLGSLGQMTRWLQRIEGEWPPPLQESVVVFRGLAASPQPSVANRAQALLPILVALDEANAQLAKRMAAARQLRFAEALVPVALPARATVARHQATSVVLDKLDRSAEAVRTSVEQARIQVEGVRKKLATTGGVDGLMARWSDPALVAGLLRDCFDGPTPKSTRTEPASAYDRVLGIELFYEVLRGDPVSSERRAWEPELFQLSALFRAVEEARLMFEQEAMRWLAADAMGRQVEEWKRISTFRERLVKQLLEQAGLKTGREALLCAGMVQVLTRAPGQLLLGGIPLRDWIHDRLNEMRIALLALDREYTAASAERQIEIREKVLATGLPGDTIVRRMWLRRMP